MLSKFKELYLKYFITLLVAPMLLYVPRLLKHRGHLKEPHHGLSLQISSLKYQLYVFCI